MPDNMYEFKPKVNEAHEFLQIAENFKEPLEIIREALSNSWDAHASNVVIDVSLDTNKGLWRPTLSIVDDGDGMNKNEIEGFFSLGYSFKPKNSIGSKGHGTKIYYRSEGIKVETVSKANGKKIFAETDSMPYDSLKQGKLPTIHIREINEDNSLKQNGTEINIHRFNARPLKDFGEIKDRILPYIKLYTIGGSFEHYFSPNARKMNISIINWKEPKTSMDNWFLFPEDNLNAEESSKLCKIFATKTYEGETAESHIQVKVQVVGCVVGEKLRSNFVLSREDMGVWLAKDFIKIERDEHLTRKLQLGKKSGEYYYPNFLILANCQQFNLPANREDIQRDEVYALVADKIKEYIKEIGNDTFTIKFFDMKKEESEKEDLIRKQETIKQMDKRIDDYKKRPTLPPISEINRAIVKIPKNEKETLLLLQAMISSNHKGIDFIIGEYGDYEGVDAIIEFDDKGTHRVGWLEMVYELSRIIGWWHELRRIHKIVCWDIGNMVPDTYKLANGKSFDYIRKDREHFIKYETDFIKVYVLKEILGIING